MKSYQQFFAELKRRHVFKVAAVYGAVAFALIQVAEPMASAMRLPETFVPFVVALLILGFPVALVLAWAFEVTPGGVKRTDDAAPGEIEGILAAPALQRWTAGLLALVGVAALVAGAWWAGKQSSTGAGAEAAASSTDRVESMQLALSDVSEDPRPSIAVLPFVNMSADEDQEYFSDGMTEEILNTLANIDDLRVSGRTSAFAYKGRSVDLRQIGQELGVRYLVEGSVRKAGDQLRITAQLIDANDGSHLWSDQYDRAMDDVFAVQTEIAKAIAEALTVPLGLEPDEALVTPTGDLAAYDLYLAGRRLMRERSDDGLAEAMRLFRAAVDRDSTWAPAWAALAEVTEISIWYPGTYGGLEDADPKIRARLEAAESAATRALELDPRNASALVALGSVHRDRGEWDESERAYLRAIAIDPDNAEAHQQYGEMLGNVGRIAESVRALDRAVALDPAEVRITNLAFSLDRDDRADEAREVLEVGLSRNPDTTFPALWNDIATQYARAGDIERATDEMVRLRSVHGSPPWMDDVEASRSEWRQFTRGIAEQDMDLVPERLRPLLYPDMWATMGSPEEALESLDPIAFVGQHWIPDIWMPGFDHLRDRPEFRERLEAAGLAGANVQRTPADERTRPLILQAVQSAAEAP